MTELEEIIKIIMETIPKMRDKMSDRFAKVFGNQLKNLRKGKGYTQNDVASLLGVPVSTYANWEQGRRDPRIYDIIMLMDIFEVSPNEFFSFENCDDVLDNWL
jgi:transcriptional regulator with XRE-family HTH domain